MSNATASRRPIKARDTRWAAGIAASLARAGVKPNTISVMSAVFAAAAGVCFWATPRFGGLGAAVLFAGGALGVQLRLLCNLFDGMVAVEGGFKTKSGEVFNELPDRFADAFVLIGCGYAAAGSVSCGITLGWTAAAIALVTAYVRALGASAGAGQCFLGPMAKQHRMAMVTASALLAAAASVSGFYEYRFLIVTVALGTIVAGGAVTVVRRTLWVIRTLEAK